MIDVWYWCVVVIYLVIHDLQVQQFVHSNLFSLPLLKCYLALPVGTVYDNKWTIHWVKQGLPDGSQVIWQPDVGKLLAISGYHNYPTMRASRHLMVRTSGPSTSFSEHSPWSCWICCVRKPTATSVSGHNSRASLSTNPSGKRGLTSRFQRWEFSSRCSFSWGLIVDTPIVRTGRLTGCWACQVSVLLCLGIGFLPFFVSSTFPIILLRCREVSLAMIDHSRSDRW